MPDFNLDGRVALITGAARGIGLAIAKALAAAGAAVVIQDIEQRLAEREANAIVTAGGKALGIGGDATDVAQAPEWINRTTDHFGGLDILINNASIQKEVPFLEASLDDMRQQFDANVHMITRLCQLAIPRMQPKKWGRIVNIGSIQGLRGNSPMAAYAMTKAAIENLTFSLARQFAGDGITANCLAPGWIVTFRNGEGHLTAEQKAANGKRIPLQRMGEADDCAGAALLLSSNAGSYITGQTIYVDGGMSI